MACALYGLLVLELLCGNAPASAWQGAKAAFKSAFANSGEREFATFNGLLTHDYTQRAEFDIESSGYVLHTLEASVWCLLTTSDFASCVLKAVNLGSDTDTTGCVAGGLAGVYYGMDAIPADWLATLPRQADLACLFKKFTEKIPSC
jgi:ADP-ribosylglycohydrolase